MKETTLFYENEQDTQALMSDLDRLVGLEVGVDDLVARVKSALRRGQMLSQGRLSIDAESYKARLDGKDLPLTLSEFKILAAIVKASGKALSRETLGSLLDHEKPVSGRTIDVHIVSLRKKLSILSESIETIRGVGYRFKGDEIS